MTNRINSSSSAAATVGSSGAGGERVDTHGGGARDPKVLRALHGVVGSLNFTLASATTSHENDNNTAQQGRPGRTSTASIPKFAQGKVGAELAQALLQNMQDLLRMSPIDPANKG